METHLSNHPDLLIHHLSLLFPLHQILHRHFPGILVLLERVIGFQADPEDGDSEHP